MNSSILKHFEEINDPREDNIRHKLIDIIFITICAVICNADNWQDIKMFGKTKYEWFKKYLELPHGIPSHDTFERVFSLLEPYEFNKSFLLWIKAINPKIEEEIINIDGKTARHSYDSINSKQALHMISAWANKAGITLGQLKVADKTNEITAIPELLDLLEIEGSTITIDAMGTQKKIVTKIIEKKADYVLALKGNQGILKEDIELYFQDAKENNFKIGLFDYHKTVEKDHGRIEIREYWTTDDIDWITYKDEWKGFASICMVRSERIIGNQSSVEERLYISSLESNAKKIGKAIRKHWGIENSLHWVLDIAFNEDTPLNFTIGTLRSRDNCRKRKNNSAENFAILRRVVLNLLKQETSCKRSIAGKRLLAGWDTTYLERVIFN